MQFKLTKSGTVTECREALNDAIAKLAGPHKQEHTVVRAIAHYIVEENLDPLYVPWVAACTAAAEDRAKGRKAETPSEPTTSFTIDCSVSIKEVARQ